MASEGSSSSRRTLLIHEIKIRITWPTKKSRFRLKITPGNKRPTETKEIKVDRVGVMPKWTQKLMLDVDPQTKILWELYGRRVLRSELFGSIEVLGELFEGTSTDIHVSDGSSEVAVLKISGKFSSAKDVMMDAVPNIKNPSESPMFLDDSDTLQKVFDAMKTMIDTLVGVHPVATIAWGFLSIGFEIVKNQRDTK
ncbi:uncharacterized protein ARMOST_21126 [Armillaria ostoyae]|uniref:C2 domain-containing protein n=1 Tax=Armillaria ostoyae TaxID=47428 RepID=A0A284S987_ARMOS|nr:uncharacterized protein ARMOST_21126 [Armillaria ostoyae]